MKTSSKTPVLARLAVLFLLALLASGPAAFAQKYYPLAASEPWPDNLTEYQGRGAFAQDAAGRVYAGFSYGVAVFDGLRKELARTPSPVGGLAVSADGKTVAAACDGAFGLVRFRAGGAAYFFPLKTGVKGGEIPPQVFAYGEGFAFVYEKHVYTFDGQLPENPEEKPQIKTVAAPGATAGAFSLGNNIFVNIAEKGLFKLSGGALAKADVSGWPAGETVLCYGAFDKTAALVGLSESGVYKVSGGSAAEWGGKSARGAFTGIARVGDKVALSTPNSGCIVASASGQAEALLNIGYGLAENDVNAVFADREGRLWLAHNQQFAWVYLQEPLNHYPEGLVGAINAIHYSDELYIATDDGVYKFTKFRSTGILDEDELLSVLSQSTKRSGVSKSAAKVKKKLRKGLSKIGIKLKKGKKEQTRETMTEMYRDIQASRRSSVKRVDFARLLDVPEEKFFCFAESGGDLYAGSLGGVYRIAGNRARRVSGVSARVMVPLPDGRLAVAEAGKGAGLLDPASGDYQPLEQVGAYVNSMAAAGGALWLGTADGLLQTSLGGGKPNKIQPGGAPGEARVFTLAGKPVAWAGGKMYALSGGKAAPADRLTELLRDARAPLVYDAGSEGWLLSGAALYRIDAGLKAGPPNTAPGLMGEIRALHPAGDYLWLGAGEELFRLEMGGGSPLLKKRDFAVALAGVEIIGLDEPLEGDVSDLSLPYSDDYRGRIRLAAPAFDNAENFRYEYRADGGGWIPMEGAELYRDFPYGNYDLEFRALDALGNISEPVAFALSIAAPFWARWYFWALVVLLLLAGAVLFARQRQRQLEARNRWLEAEVDKATAEINRLLHNILPQKIVGELKTRNRVQPVRYDRVSVLFTDFKGFTKIAEKLTPEEIVAELDKAFAAFDEICRAHGLEKIKTIGDAYMCAGGVPDANKTHPLDITLAALAFQDWMARLWEEKTAKGELIWELRLGVHTGPLVAGVVGTSKFAYDVWGDTVNTASRMESSGAPGKVNISEDTHRLVKDFYVCESRGKIPAKNKGEIEMFFLERIRPELSADDAGRQPNEAFWQLAERQLGARRKKGAVAQGA